MPKKQYPRNPLLVCSGTRHYSHCSHELQRTSLQGAKRRYREWTPDETQFVIDTMDEAVLDVADALGRTYYATANYRLKLRKQGLV